MFKITPIQEKSRQKELCDIFGITFREDFFGYIMYDIDTEEPMGMAQFEIVGASGYISELVPFPGTSDNEAMFILGRQTMNFIDLCGAHTCFVGEDSGDMRLLSVIGFKEKRGDRYFCDMTGMFDGHCDGHKKEI